MIKGNDYSKYAEAADKMVNQWTQQQAPDPRAALAASAQEMEERHHAKQQYADFVKAAMQGLCVALGGYDGGPKLHIIAKDACDIAEATLEEMTRREVSKSESGEIGYQEKPKSYFVRGDGKIFK